MTESIDMRLLESDESRVAYAMMKGRGGVEFKEILAGLKVDFNSDDLQIIKECYLASIHDGLPLLAAMKRHLIQRGFDADSREVALEYKRIMDGIPRNDMACPRELRDSVDRLNRREVARNAKRAIDQYATQEFSFKETLEILKAINSDDGEFDPTVADIDDLIKAVIHEDENTVSYGLDSFDRYCGGMTTSRMTILAARPGVGKSDFALHIARMNLKLGKKVVIASLEMDKREIGFRMGLAEGEGNISRERAAHGLRVIDTWNGHLTVYDNGSASVAQIAARVADDTDLVIVDYLQIVQPRSKGGKRYEIVTEVSNDLRAASKRGNAAWLVLSQLSRQARDEKARPVLADLRESGSIEQDANTVMFLYEPRGRAEKGLDQELMLDIAKNRNGGLRYKGLLANRNTHTWREQP